MAARFGETPNLPPEIIFDILRRLPVKCLLKFRCVSKSWRSLISSPSFVKAHLEAAEKDSTFTDHRMIFAELWMPASDVKQSSLRSVIEQPSSIDGVSFPCFPGKHPNHFVSVVGTHDGLICIDINSKDLLLWNPATGAQATLPTVQLNLNRGFVLSNKVFGFGYSRATQDYKVLGFFSVGDRDVRNFETTVKMYSHKANSWKTIKGYKSGFPRVDSGKYVNGKLYFTVRSNHEIVSADLDLETFGVVEQPDYGAGSFEGSIGVLGDCLCILSTCSNQNQRGTHDVDIWVLKKDGIKESWTKLLRIQLKDDLFVCAYSMIVLPTGEFLLTLNRTSRYCTQLAIYNPSDKVLTFPKFRDHPRMLQRAFVYVESLVSPQLNATSN